VSGARVQALTPKRVLAMLVLPASLLPVTLLGRGMINAPRHLARAAWADAIRFERSLAPARHRAPSAPPPLARASLGKLYGNWRAFPQVGREGLIPKGPLR
jgi:hypothetical protein